MTESMKHFAFAREFTSYPGGRLRRHGPYSGESFREEILLPMLNEFDNVEIDLTGTKGFGSSFLDEAFGEAAKRLGVDRIKQRLHLKCDDDPMLIEMIEAKMEKAARER